MKRILLMVFRNLFLIPYMLIKIAYYSNHADRFTEMQKYQMLKFIVKRANKKGNIKIEMEGLENIPDQSGFICFPNHQGMYDMLALVDVFPVPISVVAKKEVENVPILKQVLKIMKAFLLDRSDIRQGMEVIKGVSEEVKKGRNYVIFAEGTRSKKGNEILDFKGGSFKAAYRAKCPIVPIALMDSFIPFDSDSIKPVTVKVKILKPISYEEYKEKKTSEMATEVHDLIQSKIAESLENEK